MIDALSLSKSFGGRTLFRDASFRVEGPEKLALVGPNGSGKTTLLRILAGEEHPDEGEVRVKKSSSIGYLPQELSVESGEPLLDFVENASGELKEVGRELDELRKRLEEGESSPVLLERLGHLQSRFEHMGGWTLRSEARRILSGLGFSDRDFSRPLSVFSGGWRMRALLGRILLKTPDVILLDEPTNHLDIVTLLWLEEFIQKSKAGFVIVSHDIAFLDRIVNGVVALTRNGVMRTKGNYTKYVEERELRAAQERASYERKMRQRAEEEKFIERFRAKNTKATQVQSRIKRLEKEEIAAPVEFFTSARPSIRFPQPERSGKEVVSLEGVRAGYGELIVYEKLDFKLYRGDKVALIGPNGAGKSTLLKLMAGIQNPLGGEMRLGHNVTRSYFSQHQMELLSPHRTVLEEILTLPSMRTEKEARSLLGAFLFSGDDVEKKVAVLSGGEKSRLVLARMLSEPGNLLLLDEPTNHLDIDACETLRNALENFEGTLAVITHDRDLINHVATKVVYVDGGRAEEFIGNYDDFERARAARQAAQAALSSEEGESREQRSSKGRDARRDAAKRREEFSRRLAPLKKEVEEAEKRIEECEKRLGAVEGLLTKPEIYADGAKLAELSRERAALEKTLEELSARWEESAFVLQERERELREELWE